MRARLALTAMALLLPATAWAQDFNPATLEYGCLPVVTVKGKVRLANAPRFHSFDLTRPGERRPVKLPRNTIGIHCSRYSLVPFADDHLILRRGLKLYIQVEEDRPGLVILLLEKTDGLPHYSIVEGQPADWERADVDAAIARFPAF